LIGEDDECVPITSHSFIWLHPQITKSIWITSVGF
jgi:hypothetical protein